MDEVLEVGGFLQAGDEAQIGSAFGMIEFHTDKTSVQHASNNSSGNANEL
jgi:hypothetical protein